MILIVLTVVVFFSNQYFTLFSETLTHSPSNSNSYNYNYLNHSTLQLLIMLVLNGTLLLNPSSIDHALSCYMFLFIVAGIMGN